MLTQDHQFGEIIPTSDIKLEDNTLGLGETAVVVSGRWNRTNIAFKKCNIAVSTQSELEKWREKLQYEVGTLSKLSHPNLMRVYSAVVEIGCIGIVLEEMLCSLCQVAFRKNRLHEAKKRRIIRQVGDGLAFLHNNKMVHCNLTTANIYLSYDNIAKIGSYGPKCVHSKFGSIAEDQVSEVEESYSAPELLHRSNLSFEQLKKADIYSLGIVTYEVMTGIKSYGGIPLLDSFSGLPHSMRELMSTCWEDNPEKRPTANNFLKDWKNF